MTIAHIQLNCLWPINSKLKKIVENFKHTVVIEMNDGQLCNILRSKIAPNAIPITQISGKPFRISDLTDKHINILNNGKQ